MKYKYVYMCVCVCVCVYESVCVCVCIKSHVREVFILVFIWKYIFWNLGITGLWRQFDKESSRVILLLLYSPSVWLSIIILNNPSTTSLTSQYPLDNVSNRRSHVCSRWKLHSKTVEAKQYVFFCLFVCNILLMGN